MNSHAVPGGLALGRIDNSDLAIGIIVAQLVLARCARFFNDFKIVLF